MSHISLFNGKNSTQEDVLFNSDGAEQYAQNIEYIASKRKAEGEDPSADYAKFLAMYNFPLIRDYKPGILSAPGVITIDQQGGTASYGSTISFRHTQAGDFSRHSQLNIVYDDIASTTVAYSGINQLIPDHNNSSDYHIHSSIVVSNPATLAQSSVVASTFRYIIGTIIISPCRPTGQLIKKGDLMQNFIVVSDYPGEASIDHVTVNVGTNEYMKYDSNYNIFRRHLLNENKRYLYDELVGQQKLHVASSEDSSTIAGMDMVYAGANNHELLKKDSVTSAEGNVTNNLSANTLTMLDTYKMRSKSKAPYTTVEHKYFSNGYQTPKAKHSNIRFSVPIWIHPTVDSENGLSNMTFASFIRVYQFSLSQKSAVFRLVPGNASLLYKSSIVFEQLRSHVGYLGAPDSAVAADNSNIEHVNLLHQHVITETEAIIPATVKESTISGGSVSSLNITSAQVYLYHSVRSVIENQSSLAIYHLPDMHIYNLPTSGSTFSINSNDSRWVSKSLALLPYVDYNRSSINPNCFKTWHKGGYSEVNHIPRQQTFDIPQNQVQHLTSLFDSTPIASGSDVNTTSGLPSYLNIDAIAAEMDGSEYPSSFLTDRYAYQTPTRKQVISGWSKLFVDRALVTSVGLRVQSFDIYKAEEPHIVVRASFFYANEGISPRDEQFFILPLALKPLDDTSNTGGLNLSKYRDIIMEGTLNASAISDLSSVNSNTSASLALCSYGYNVLITTQRSQFRRFAN